MRLLAIAIPPEALDVLKLSVMNVGTVAAGYLVGRRADQPQKIIVGAFASGIAGVVFAWALMLFGAVEMKPRLFVGIFVTSLLLGVVWTWIGYMAGAGARRP